MERDLGESVTDLPSPVSLEGGSLVRPTVLSRWGGGDLWGTGDRDRQAGAGREGQGQAGL